MSLKLAAFVSDTPRQLRPTVEGLTDEADGV